MQENELHDLVLEIHRQKTEKQTVELKSAAKGFPKIFDTLSSFANQDAGGIIIFGIGDKPDYEILGVYDPEDVQKKIMEACEQMEPPIRAVTTICEADGKLIVSAEIPGADYSKRPVFYRGVGKIKGSYVRVGDADIPMTPFEVYSYESFRKRTRDDLRTVDNARISLFDQQTLKRYLLAVKTLKKNIANMSDDEILELMGVTLNSKPTLAGIMAFSPYPQSYFPQLCITAVVVPGTEIGDQGIDGERFIDNRRIIGTISEMVEESVDFVRKNSRTKTIIGSDGQRHDRTEYPMTAVREAILNALVHRDYSIYTESIPVSIEMYRDRMMIKNSGGLFGATPIELLGKVRTETRNVALVNMLEFLDITENRYSGIPTMQKECRNAGLPDPKFEVKHGEFIVTFRNNIFETEQKIDKSDMKKAVLEFCSTPKSRSEILDFTGMSRYYITSSILHPLIEQGLLLQTIPDKPKSPKQQYVKKKD